MPASPGQSADSKLVGKSTAASKRRARSARTTPGIPRIRPMPPRAVYGITSSIHDAPSKKLASSRRTRTASRAAGKPRRTAESAGRLKTTSPSQLASLTRRLWGPAPADWCGAPVVRGFLAGRRLHSERNAGTPLQRHAIDPRLDERDARETGKAPNLLVDAPGSGTPRRPGEEIRRQEARLLGRLLRTPDRLPEPIDERARDPGGARPAEAFLRLVVVEGEVTELVAHDARQDLRQHRVVREL